MWWFTKSFAHGGNHEAEDYFHTKIFERQHFKVCNDENNRASFDLEDKLAFILGIRSSLNIFSEFATL